MAAAFLAGAALASLPQARINLVHHGDPLPTVRTAKDGGRSLFTRQLLWGVTIQKYEASMEPSRPTPTLYSMDAAGKAFFDKNNFHFGTTRIGHYLAAMARDPMFFVGLLGRHFVNGLDVRNREVYLTSPSAERHALALCNLLVVSAGFLALFGCAGRGGAAGDPAAIVWVVVLALGGAIAAAVFFGITLNTMASLEHAPEGRYLAD